jgi:hypothetical protein
LLELAYKRWSLTIAEDRGQPDISGVTLGVTQSTELELPSLSALIACLCENKALASTRESRDGFNSISRVETAHPHQLSWNSKESNGCLMNWLLPESAKTRRSWN